MANQIKAEDRSKKPGLLRRILWWLWVVLLSALLLLGLVFAVPWKVITLIAIFLAAATILPRTYHKLFWLGVGVVIIALAVWIFLPEDNEGWQPYTFDKEVAELQARYAVPDSENAAIIYDHIFETWKQKEANEPNLPDDWHALAMNGPWLSKDQPEIAAYLWYHRDTIEGTLRATKFEKCSFPIQTRYIDSGNMDAMRKGARLLVAAGNNDLAEGNISEAIQKYIDALQLGQHACQQPETMYKLAGLACEALGLGAIDNFVVLGDVNEFYLDSLEQAVSMIRHDWNADLSGFITFDKLRLKNEFGGSFYEVNSKGDVRLNSDPSAKTRESLRKKMTECPIDDPETKEILQKLIIEPGYWRRKLMKMQLWFFAPATPEKLGKLVDNSFEKYYTMTKSDYDWSNIQNKAFNASLFKFNYSQLIMISAKISEELYIIYHNLYLRKSAGQKGTLLMIAMRRYKNANSHWPEKLEDITGLVPAEVLIDPINNDSFVYKRTGDNFMLYSKGCNNIDEDGENEVKYMSDYRKSEIKDDEMIWPHKESGCN